MAVAITVVASAVAGGGNSRADGCAAIAVAVAAVVRSESVSDDRYSLCHGTILSPVQMSRVDGS